MPVRAAASLFLACLSAWVFLRLAEEIWFERETFAADLAFSRWMASHQTDAGLALFSAVTLLGNWETVVAVALASVAMLLRHRRRQEAAIFLVGLAAASASVGLVKTLSARARPPAAIAHDIVTWAFPSGHTAVSLFLYGFVAYLLSRRTATARGALATFLSGVGIAMAVGASRLYLNVHWLTDVAAGFTLGAACLAGAIAAVEWAAGPPTRAASAPSP